MRKISNRIVFFVLAAMLIAGAAVAQDFVLPRVSPAASVGQRIGITDVTISYHRPSVNGRELWGALVPYDTVWRAGANDNTTITFTDDVRIEGEPLAAGTYGLHMIPGESDWTVIFSNDSVAWGSFSYDPALDALRVTVAPESADFAEQLYYGFENVTRDAADAYLHWGEKKVYFNIEVDTLDVAVDYIRGRLRHVPGFAWQGWNQAAQFCLQNNVNLEEAMQWVDRSISMEENAQNLMVKGGLLSQMGKTSEAAEFFAKAVDSGNEAQVNAIGYFFLFQVSDPDKAIEVFKKNTVDHPDSWNVWDSLGEAYANKGDNDAARKNYEKALGMAPDGQKGRIQGVLDGLK